MMVQDEIGEKKNPMGLKRFNKYFGKNGQDIVGGALANAEAVKVQNGNLCKLFTL